MWTRCKKCRPSACASVSKIEGDDPQNLVGAIFRISSPIKFGAPLNFAFALRPMGRKISNRLYSSFRSSFGLIFTGVLGWMCESLFWDFALWDKFLTRFLSIFVCFTPFLVFPEPLKPACWNFHTPYKYDGANSGLSQSCKNYSGGSRGGQISTDRSQIYTRGGGWLATSFDLNNNFGEFPQPVSLSFSGQNSRGYIPVPPRYIEIKFAGYVDTLSGCRPSFRNRGLPLNLAPREGQIFRYTPTVGHLADKFTQI